MLGLDLKKCGLVVVKNLNQSDDDRTKDVDTLFAVVEGELVSRMATDSPAGTLSILHKTSRCCL